MAELADDAQTNRRAVGRGNLLAVVSIKRGRAELLGHAAHAQIRDRPKAFPRGLPGRLTAGVMDKQAPAPVRVPTRNLTDAVDGILNGKRYRIHDRDPSIFTTGGWVYTEQHPGVQNGNSG
jgi:hypothetical protein